MRELSEAGINAKGMSSEEIKNKLNDNNLPVHYMSGTNGMLPTSFVYEPPSKQDRIHQSQKPKELYSAIEKYITKEFEWVLDQFAGSCALGEASLEVNRNSILFEIDSDMVNEVKKYYDNNDITLEVLEELEEELER